MVVVLVLVLVVLVVVHRLTPQVSTLVMEQGIFSYNGEGILEVLVVQGEKGLQVVQVVPLGPEVLDTQFYLQVLVDRQILDILVHQVDLLDQVVLVVLAQR